MSGYVMTQTYTGDLDVQDLRKAVYQDVFDAAAERESAGDADEDWEEYGLTPESVAKEAANIYVDDRVYESRKAAEEACSAHGNYNGKAVRFVSIEYTKTMNELKERIEREKQKGEEYFEKHHVRYRKSQYVGCTKCGSRINKDYVGKDNVCPCCGQDFFSETDNKRMMAYASNIRKWMAQLVELKQKHVKTTWLVVTRHH